MRAMHDCTTVSQTAQEEGGEQEDHQDAQTENCQSNNAAKNINSFNVRCKVNQIVYFQE